MHSGLFYLFEKRHRIQTVVLVTVARTVPRVSWTQLGLTATGVNVILDLQGTNVKVSKGTIEYTNVKVSKGTL